MDVDILIPGLQLNYQINEDYSSSTVQLNPNGHYTMWIIAKPRKCCYLPAESSSSTVAPSLLVPKCPEVSYMAWEITSLVRLQQRIRVPFRRETNSMMRSLCWLHILMTFPACTSSGEPRQFSVPCPLLVFALDLCSCLTSGQFTHDGATSSCLPIDDFVRWRGKGCTHWVVHAAGVLESGVRAEILAFTR